LQEEKGEETGSGNVERDNEKQRTHFVARIQTLQRLLIQPRQSQVSNLDLSLVGNQNIRRLEIAMDDPVVVEVRDAVEELPEEGFEDADGELSAG
jgi:hypothetical protein